MKKREKRINNCQSDGNNNNSKVDALEKDESKKPIKVALYARVSSRESQERQDPENQLRILRRRAEWDEVDVHKEYVDHAPGSDPNRPALSQMLRDMKAMRFRRIYVVRLDRITRSLKNLLTMIESFDKNGVEFVCTEQDIRTDTSTGKLMINFLGAIAEFESDLISERTKEGLARAAAQGRFPGRISIDIDMKTARVLRSDGMSYSELAEFFNVSKATICRRFKKGG